MDGLFRRFNRKESSEGFESELELPRAFAIKKGIAFMGHRWSDKGRSQSRSFEINVRLDYRRPIQVGEE